MNVRSENAGAMNTGQEKPKKFDVKLRAVLDSAAKVIARDGYEGASIRQVAQETGLSLAGLYHYFSSKEELLTLIQYHTFSSLLDSLDASLSKETDPLRKLEILVDNHFTFFTTHMDDLKVCAYELESLSGENFEKVAKLRRRYYDVALEIVKTIVERNPASKLDPRLTTFSLFGMLNWIFMWYPGQKKITVERMREQLLMLFLGGISGGC
ncbi:MAG: TetR/AcrR family transcriptional regulator [Planctomycetes bacterium]|nr:TetR/AcrR family transcriptional regulator [Planctomycetota bacterium]